MPHVDVQSRDYDLNIILGFNHKDKGKERDGQLYISAYGEHRYGAFSLKQAIELRDKLTEIIDYFGAPNEQVKTDLDKYDFKVGDRVRVVGNVMVQGEVFTITEIVATTSRSGTHYAAGDKNNYGVWLKFLEHYVEPTVAEKLADLPPGSLFRFKEDNPQTTYLKTFDGTAKENDYNEEYNDFTAWNDLELEVIYDPEETL